MSIVTLYGDAGGSIGDFAHGGDDYFKFTATGISEATVCGDAGTDMSGFAHGGNDTCYGAQNVQLTFFGDAGGGMSGFAVGGNDSFYAATTGHSENVAYGDAFSMTGFALGGNDHLTGGNSGSTLVGDANTMSGNAHGGNDVLISGTGNDLMWGDAQTMLGGAQGGNDVFVFNVNNGHDSIGDFGQSDLSQWGHDLIDVSALGIHDFSGLNISAYDPVTQESTITFSPGNDVVVHSQSALTLHDFIFA